MRTPRITKATHGLACSACTRTLELGERYYRDDAVTCEPCMAPVLKRTTPNRTRAYVKRQLCTLCRAPSSFKECAVCVESIARAVAKIKPYTFPIPRSA